MVWFLDTEETLKFLARGSWRKLAALAVVGFSGIAWAQASTSGFALDRFVSPAAGSYWSSLDSLDLRGGLFFAARVGVGYANRPLVLYRADGAEDVAAIEDQAVLYGGVSAVLLHQVRLSVVAPLALASRGTEGKLFTTVISPPSQGGPGDVRLGADVRLFGEFHQALTSAAGIQVFLPTGRRERLTGDGGIRLHPAWQVAGELESWAYAARVGVLLRQASVSLGPVTLGSELTFGGGVGWRPEDSLRLGLEVSGAVQLAELGQYGSMPLEVMASLQYQFVPDWRLVFSGGPGMTQGVGTPRFRFTTSLEWFQSPLKDQKIRDTDDDGIPDSSDACLYQPGPGTSDPATNGCPAFGKGGSQ